jgi:hypothetical protein
MKTLRDRRPGTGDRKGRRDLRRVSEGDGFREGRTGLTKAGYNGNIQ